MHNCAMRPQVTHGAEKEGKLAKLCFEKCHLFFLDPWSNLSKENDVAFFFVGAVCHLLKSKTDTNDVEHMTGKKSAHRLR